ncbi:O-methyltransferase [Crocinitomix catalasitica]|uniref:O-methyltransferase n=1 Tax=Crocinitomix catalasitica TaxID=184607 RepID=UPI0004883934|nr:O-methyltransferase [Crocinitomix catalasitica]
MDFLDEKLEEYLEVNTSEESKELNDLSRETHLKVLRPRMLSGHLQGRFLSMISKMINPKYILEIGTYTGYSAMCLAEGLNPEGKLVTIDRNDELKPILSKYLMSSEYASKIDLHFGLATDIIPTLEGGIDLVFLDADKPNYANYFNLVIDKLNPGGFILADNVLWSGKVVEEANAADKSTQAIVDFNKMVNDDERVENVMLPIRDGITLIRKK